MALDALHVLKPNDAAQAGRATRDRIGTETAQRPCLQPAGSAQFSDSWVIFRCPSLIHQAHHQNVVSAMVKWISLPFVSQRLHLPQLTALTIVDPPVFGPFFCGMCVLEERHATIQLVDVELLC